MLTVERRAEYLFFFDVEKRKTQEQISTTVSNSLLAFSEGHAYVSSHFQGRGRGWEA